MNRNRDGQGGFWKEGALELGLDNEKDGGRVSPGERPVGTKARGRKELGGSGSWKARAGQGGRGCGPAGGAGEGAGPGLCWLWGLVSFGI